MGLNGKIVVYNDTSSAAAASGKITHSRTHVLTSLLTYLPYSGALDIPVATQIFKVSSITGYDYHIWALNNQAQHTQVLTYSLTHSSTYPFTHSLTHVECACSS